MIWETTLLEQQNLSIFLLTQHPYIENMFVHVCYLRCTAGERLLPCEGLCQRSFTGSGYNEVFFFLLQAAASCAEAATRLRNVSSTVRQQSKRLTPISS